MRKEDIAAFSLWLTERCEFLHNLEREAERVLQQEKDTEKYKALMCQKAMFLQALPEEAEDRADLLPDDTADMVMERLEYFSGNASRALRVGSVFFMYALLYPDDHKKGDPNDLDKLAAEVRTLAAKA